MQDFESRPHRSRRLSRAVIVVAAVLALSGGTFAATGGIAKLRQWLFTVEVEGVSAQILVPENGEGTVRFETEKGVATVAVQKTNSPETGEMTQVNVVVDEEGAQTEDVVKMIRRRADAADAETRYSVEDLGDAEPYADWTDENGAINEVFLLPTEDGTGTKIFLATTPPAAAEEPTVRLVATPPLDMLSSDVAPVVAFEEGVLSIDFADGQGREGQIKLRLRTAAADDMPDAFDVGTPDGKVKIKLEGPREDE